MPTNITPEHQQWLDNRVITRYGFDKSGIHSDNHIEDEHHYVLREDGTYSQAIAPREGAFYTNSMIITNLDDDVTMVKGTRDANGNLPAAGTFDYFCSEPSAPVGSITGLEACYVVIFVGQPPEEVGLNYQVVGGQYVHDSAIMMRIYQNLKEQWVEWDDILNKQERFNGTYHGHNIDDVYGWEYIVEAIDRLGRVMELGHIPSYNAMIKKFCDITSRAIRPRLKVNHKDLFNGVPDNGYITKTDLMHILYTSHTKQAQLYNKSFESVAEPTGAHYRHAVMSVTPAESFWQVNQMFSVEYLILDKKTGEKSVRLVNSRLRLMAMPDNNGPNKMGFRQQSLNASKPWEVVVSIAIYHASMEGVNLCIHYDGAEDDSYNYTPLGDRTEDVTAYPS